MNLKETQKYKFSPDWWDKLEQEFDQDYMKYIYSYIIERVQEKVQIFPSSDKVYKAFEYPFNNIKVVILGQD